MIRSVSRTFAGAVLFLTAGVCSGQDVYVNGYVNGYEYAPQSYYSAPPAYVNGPLYPPTPVLLPQPVVTETVIMADPVVAYRPVLVARRRAVVPSARFYAPPGYAVPIPGRHRETWSGGRLHNRYKYEVRSPYGPDYEYTIRRDNGRVRVNEKWKR